MMDLIMKGMIALMIGAVLMIIFYAIPRDIVRSQTAAQIATEMGCEVIGSARDLNSVKFLDCNGEVKVIRVK